jgi:hypothetical protein
MSRWKIKCLQLEITKDKYRIILVLLNCIKFTPQEQILQLKTFKYRRVGKVLPRILSKHIRFKILRRNRTVPKIQINWIRWAKHRIKTMLTLIVTVVYWKHRQFIHLQAATEEEICLYNKIASRLIKVYPAIIKPNKVCQVKAKNTKISEAAKLLRKAVWSYQKLLKEMS